MTLAELSLRRPVTAVMFFVSMVIIGLIASTRLPRKVLLDLGGKPVVQHVWERAKQVRQADRVVLLTDSEEVAGIARGFGAEVLMTDPGYPCNKNFVEFVSGVPRPLPVGPENNYQLSARQVEENWTESTRAVMVVLNQLRKVDVAREAAEAAGVAVKL